MTANTEFCRALLKLTHREIKILDPQVKLRDAWVYHLGRDHWEFHYGDFYWHGDADNAYDARVNGWGAWLEKQKDFTPE